MQEQLNNDILKAVCVRFIVNPELGHEGVTETDEMCQKTIAKLRWLDEVRPRCVLVADLKNKDPHAVMVRAMGEKVAYLDMSQAPEIRGMLKATPRGMLSTTIDSVNIYEHGFFFLKKPVVREPYTPEDIGVDWSRYQCNELLLLPNDYFLSHDELSMVIYDELLPDLPNVSIEELRQYFTLWLKSARYNQSREVQEEMAELITKLSADEREEIRDIAVEIDHLRTKKGTKEIAEEMAEVWWQDLMDTDTVRSEFRRITLGLSKNESFSLVKQRCNNDRQGLLCILDKVEELMRPMPGELYNDVGDVYQFFSHMNYLAPPMTALRGILSLLAIRTLLCKELGFGTEPYFGSRVEMITDVKLMPTTIGKVMEFAQTQCKEYAEVLTVQRLANFLKDDYEGSRNEEIEGILTKIKPAPNISIGILNGTATGEAKQNFTDSTLAETNEASLLPHDNNPKLLE